MTNIDTQWQRQPAIVDTPRNTVHIWRVVLEQPVDRVHSLRPLLSTDEITKADRFHFEVHRQRYIVAHAALRWLLAHYLHIDPAQAKELDFTHNDYGKPALAETPALGPLNFNLSHSQDLALLAFTDDRQIGVDVEQIRPNLEYVDLAKRYFSPQENTMLAELPPMLQQHGFYHCWTCKEAYIKARGLGLSLPLHIFDVSVHPEQPARVLGSREHESETTRWHMRTLQPGDGYVGALAVEGVPDQIQCWDLVDFQV